MVEFLFGAAAGGFVVFIVGVTWLDRLRLHSYELGIKHGREQERGPSEHDFDLAIMALLRQGALFKREVGRG